MEFFCKDCEKKLNTERGCKTHNTRMHPGVEFELAKYIVQEGADPVEVVEEVVSPKKPLEPVQTAPTPIPTATPPKKVVRYTEVPEGSVINVTTTPESGLVWRQDIEHPNLEGFAPWVAREVEDADLTVLKRMINNNEWMLICKAPQSFAQFAVLEARVLNGFYKLVSIPKGIAAPIRDDEDFKPSPEMSAVDPEAEARKVALEEIRPKLREYGQATLDRLAAEKNCEKLRSVNYEDILEAVKKYGSETKKDSGDSALYEEGFRFLAFSTKDREITVRDADKIIPWLIANKMSECLSYSLNVEEWEKAIRGGHVPPEVVRQFQHPDIVEGVWKIRIEKDETA